MENLTELWQTYITHKSAKAREELILHYTFLAKYAVARLGLKLPRSLEQEDLLSYGVMGLIEAVDRFDLSYGVKFESFALARIKGQIIDSIRALDILPRSVYRHAKDIETAFGELNQSLNRVPTDKEVASVLQISLKEYYKWLNAASWVVVSLDQPIVFGNGEQMNLYDSLEDEKMSDPASQFDKQEIKGRVVHAIKELPDREQLMISLYYNDGLTMKEIGEVLGVSESRVSQMHAKTILVLKSIINLGAKSSMHATRTKRGRYASAFSALS